MEVFLPALIKENTLAAARLVESLEPWASREEAMHQLARAWARLDPDKAARWAAALQDRVERDSALNDVCLQLAQTEPRQAIETALRYSSHDTTLRNQLVSLWGSTDFAAALKWVEQSAGVLNRDQAYAQLARIKAESVPAEAAGLVVERMSAGSLQDEAAMAVLHQWVLRDPGGAVAWVNQFPAGKLRLRAQGEIDGMARYTTHAERESEVIQATY